jgi:hypothetical protein
VNIARMWSPAASPTRTPRAMPTMVAPAVTRDAAPSMRSSPRYFATPTKPRAPGISSQNAGRKLTKVGGPDFCVAANTATGVITMAPKNAERMPPKNNPPRTCPA